MPVNKHSELFWDMMIVSGVIACMHVASLSCRYCSKCQEHRPARKTLELWRLPKVLVSVPMYLCVCVCVCVCARVCVCVCEHVGVVMVSILLSPTDHSSQEVSVS